MNADHGQGASSSSVGHAIAGENDCITMDNFVQDMADSGGDDDGDLGEAALEDPEDAEYFEEFIN